MRPAPELCGQCRRPVPFQWMPAVCCGGRSLAGTGLWRSDLTEDRCPECEAQHLARVEEARRQTRLKRHLVRIMGGERPFREFTFDRFRITAANRQAFVGAKEFGARRAGLYLWGPCGVGKTHLAYAAAHACAERGQSLMILTPAQLVRKVRMREPAEEQEILSQLIRTQVLVLDDLGMNYETAFARQILQEILDGRDFQECSGLLVTSKYSLDSLAAKLNDDTIPSRLAGMCSVIEIRGPDGRLGRSVEATTGGPV